MPSAVSVLCQIKSKGLDGGFVNGLANYMISPKTFRNFHYGFYKKQTSLLFLHDLNIKDYALVSGKCIFDNEDMYIMVSTAFKVELIEDEVPLTGPYISFVGKVYSKPKQDDNDCVFGVNVTEYNNNFNFTNKGKINFKIQVVYDAGQDSRFNIRNCKRLENSINELPNTSSSQSLFSRTQKFKTNKPISIKKEKSLYDEIEKTIFSTQDQKDKDNEEQSNKTSSANQGNKRKSQLGDLSLQRLKKTKNLNKDNEEFGLDNQVTSKELSQPIKHSDKEKRLPKSSSKTTKITTRSQKKR